MRILHTSDWHLGRSFHREGLLDAQSRFVDHLIETARAEQVDVVAVSGDVFDRALPPVDAVQVASDALRRLVSARIRVVLTSGNHDSAPRLGFASDLIDAAGVHIRTDPASVGRPVLLPDADGEVAFYPLPYLEPDLVSDPWQLPQRSHQAALDEAMSRVRADLRARPASTRSVVLSHAFVVGARPSDSERDISVGGVAAVGLDTFADVDYVALGHLHGRHTMAEQVRYSGSPLAYSFSEARQVKGSWLVDLGPDGLRSAEFVEAPVPRPLAILRGDLDELLADRRHEAAERCWVQATLTDAVRPTHALERLRTRFPHTLVVQFEARGVAAAPSTPVVGPNSSTAGDLDVITAFYGDVRSAPPTDDELRLLADACDACRLDEDVAS